MKRFALFLFALFLLTSCTAQDENDKMFCKKLGFDEINGKIHITALVTFSGQSTPEDGREKIFTRTAKDPTDAVAILTDELERVLFKPTREMIFGHSLDEESVFEIMSLLANRVEFQLKCDVFYALSAREAIENNSEKDENEGVSFSSFFRNMTGEQDEIG